MQQGARLSAAIEILCEMAKHHRPASMALRDWGRAHRFAGSGDRAAIGNLVYDVLRQKSSLAWRMGDDSPRSLLLGLAGDKLFDGSKFAPEPLTPEELKALETGSLDSAPDHVRGDYPEWLHGSFSSTFGENAAQEGAALATRAPLDLRVNTLKADRDKVKKALKKYGAENAPHSPCGLRIMPPQGTGRLPNIEADAAHGKGWFEIQDEASQLAAMMAGAKPGMQVADICAGAGGKTLALAALMENRGQIHAYDSDKHRLRPIWERLKRAGVRNVQVMESGDEQALAALSGKMDIAFVDAPCTGSGSWRRKPDVKWRLTQKTLDARIAQQRDVLQTGAGLVKPGGRLVYVTCSVLQQENNDQVNWFLKEYPEFNLTPYEQAWRDAPPSADSQKGGALLLTPAQHNMDGFFIAVFARVA